MSTFPDFISSVTKEIDTDPPQRKAIIELLSKPTTKETALLAASKLIIQGWFDDKFTHSHETLTIDEIPSLSRQMVSYWETHFRKDLAETRRHLASGN